MLLFAVYSFSSHTAQAQHSPELFKEPLELKGKGKLHEAAAALERIRAELIAANKRVSDDYYYASAYLIDVYTKYGKFLEASAVKEEVANEVTQNASNFVRSIFEKSCGILALTKSNNFELALSHFKTASPLAQIAKDTASLLEMQLLTANILSYKGSYQEAESYLQKGLKFSIESFGPKHFRVATVYSLLGQNQQYQQNVDDALSYFKKFTEIALYEIDPELHKDRVYSESDSLTSFYQDVLALEQEVNFLDKIHPADLSVFVNIGHMLLELGELKMVQELFQAMVNCTEKRKLPLISYNSKMGLANVYQRLSQGNYALELYKESIQQIKQSNDTENANTVWIYHNMAIIYGEQGDYATQLEMNLKTLKVRQDLLGENHIETAASLVNLGSTYYNLKRYQESLNVLDAALKAGYNDPGYLYYEKGRSFGKLGLLDSAKRNLKLSLSLSEEEDPFYSTFSEELGDLFMNQSKPDSANYYYRRALDANYAADLAPTISENSIDTDRIQNLFQFLTSLSKIGDLFLLQYQTTSETTDLINAALALDLCKKLISEIRGSFVQELDQIAFNQLTSEIVEKGIEIALARHTESGDQKYLEDAFRFSNLQKSQILLNAIKSQRLAQSQGNEALIRWGTLKNRIKYETAALRQQQVGSKSRQAESAILNKLKRQLAKLLTEIQQNQPLIYQYLTQADEFDMKALGRYLASKEAILIDYFWGTDNLYVFTMQEGQLSVFQPQMERKELKNRVIRFNDFVENPESMDSVTYARFLQDGCEIHQALLSPVTVKADGKHLLISADSLLSKLPFEALLTTNQPARYADFKNLPYLIKSREVSYLSSVSLLLSDKEVSLTSADNEYKAWAPFSDNHGETTDADLLRSQKLAELPGATNELRALDGHFQGVSYFSKAASESVFKKEAGAASIIHIATHGLIDDESPLLSKLLFGTTEDKDSVDDNQLYMFEIYGLSLNAELAMLTACNSGRGRLTTGEGAMSLARAFKYAGVKSVIMSQWLANDQSTSTIVSDFYQNLSDGDSKSTSLRNAKLDYLNNAKSANAHPFYWSHLVLSGDSSSLGQRSGGFFWWLIGLVSLVFLVFILGSLRKKNPQYDS